MTKYDDIIEENRQKQLKEEEEKAERQREKAILKERLTGALKNGLPEFYEALLKNDKWYKTRMHEKVLIFHKYREFEYVPFIQPDSDGHPHSMNYVIGKDGKYYFQEYFYGEEKLNEVSADELISAIYDSNWDKVYDWTRKQLLEKDPDDVITDYFSKIIKRVHP